MCKVIMTNKRELLTDDTCYEGWTNLFTVSYGGGMGGSKRYLLSDSEFSRNELNEARFINIKLLNGDVITVNTNFIVSIEYVRVSLDMSRVEGDWACDSVILE